MQGDDFEDIKAMEDEVARLRVEQAQLRQQYQDMLQQCGSTIAALQTDTAKVVAALDCAVQTVDALIAWMPEGLTLSPEVKGAKERLDKAMHAVMGKPLGGP